MQSRPATATSKMANWEEDTLCPLLVLVMGEVVWDELEPVFRAVDRVVDEVETVTVELDTRVAGLVRDKLLLEEVDEELPLRTAPLTAALLALVLLVLTVVERDELVLVEPVVEAHADVPEMEN